MTLELSCVVSGSFTKAKARIDKAIDCFENNGIRVLSPSKGGLHYPEPSSYWRDGSYPLEVERMMPEFQAKIMHINAIRRADFLYIVAPDGYIGDSVGFEVGTAYGCNIPIYSENPIESSLEEDLGWSEHLRLFQIKSPEEMISQIWKDRKKPLPGLWLPRWYGFELYKKAATEEFLKV
jgi:hypothetical protein